MTVEISEHNMGLIQEALATQIRLLKSYINPDDELRSRIMNFERLKNDVDDLMLRV